MGIVSSGNRKESNQTLERLHPGQTGVSAQQGKCPYIGLCPIEFPCLGCAERDNPGGLAWITVLHLIKGKEPCEGKPYLLHTVNTSELPERRRPC